jgi:hypothetical protein
MIPPCPEPSRHTTNHQGAEVGLHSPCLAHSEKFAAARCATSSATACVMLLFSSCSVRCSGTNTLLLQAATRRAGILQSAAVLHDTASAVLLLSLGLSPAASWGAPARSGDDSSCCSCCSIAARWWASCCCSASTHVSRHVSRRAA